MPTFDNVEVTVTSEVNIDFEVFCGTCGDGLCSESDTRRSRNRNYLQVTVNACPKCMHEKDIEIRDLTEDRKTLENKIYELEQELLAVQQTEHFR